MNMNYETDILENIYDKIRHIGSEAQESLDNICDELHKANSLKETELEMKQAELDKLDELLNLLKEKGNNEK